MKYFTDADAKNEDAMYKARDIVSKRKVGHFVFKGNKAKGIPDYHIVSDGKKAAFTNGKYNGPKGSGEKGKFEVGYVERRKTNGMEWVDDSMFSKHDLKSLSKESPKLAKAIRGNIKSSSRKAKFGSSGG